MAALKNFERRFRAGCRHQVAGLEWPLMRRSSQPGEHASRPPANCLVTLPGEFFVTLCQRRLLMNRDEGPKPPEEHKALPVDYGRLDPQRHFIARATGNSMNGGKQPIRDGDYLLLELVTPSSAGSITGNVMAIERQDASGDSQYLLRVVNKVAGGTYILKANNPDYEDLPATDEMRTLARLKALVDPLDFVLGESFDREQIPSLFGETFNPGNWNVGHIVLNEQKIHVLLVTLNKQGKADQHRYHDYWIDANTFHWQSQNATTPTSKRGQELIQHEMLGIRIHLFVRETKLQGGKGAPFVYVGKVRYRSHEGSRPMSVIFSL